MGHKKELPTIIKDSRERDGYNFRSSDSCAGMIVKKLDYGDYSIENMTDLIVIERKHSVTELCTNFGKYRKRFERELERMKDTKYKYVVIEDYWSSIWKRGYSKMNPNVVFGSIIAFQLKYDVPFIFAGNKKMAGRIVRDLLVKAYDYRVNGVI